MKTLLPRNFVVLAAALAAFNAYAAPEALELRHSVSLSDYEGKTFLEAMLQSRTGIKAQLDDDYVDTYEFASWDAVETALDHFDDKIVRRVLGAFDGNRSRLRSFVQGLEGSEFTPETLVGLIRENYRGSGNIYALEHFFAIAAISSAGSPTTSASIIRSSSRPSRS
jgi:hypothetical protein